VTDVMSVEGTVWVVWVVTSSVHDSVVDSPVMEVSNDETEG
jgi:hypothetical protein